MDLFRYTSSGVADYPTAGTGRRRISRPTAARHQRSDANLPNKGAPTLSYNNQYNSNGSLNNGGDTADWVQQSVFGSTGGGETLALTQTELDVMQALGWIRR